VDYYEGIIKNTEFFTTSELAKKLKMNVQVITRKVQAGEIKAYKIGKDWRIPEQAVYDWLEGQSNGRSEQPADPASQPPRTRAVVRRQPETAAGGRQTPRGNAVGRSARRHLLEFILAQFEPDREYTADEVNRIISRYFRNVDELRQEIVDEQLLEQRDDRYRRRSGYVL
jgi:excisionase family DNA binding protein